MDSFLSNVTSKIGDHGDDKKTPTTTAAATTTQEQQHHTPSSSELFTSAKTVADAAKAKFSNQEFDQAKAASAAANLLDAASQYGKLEDDKGVGKYVDQAGDYLRKYSTTSTTTTTTATTTATAHPADAEKGHGPTDGQKSEGGHEDSGSGFMKMAGDFLNKH